MDENTILVTGSKGGVGTSTVALNLAVQLAQQTRKRVALIDLARPFGQISLMLDMEPRFTVLDALERITRLDEAVLRTLTMRHKAGINVLAGPLHVPMKPEQRLSVTLEGLTALLGIADQAFDYVVVDVGVVNPAEWAAVLREAAQILLVAEPTILALGMVRRHLAASNCAGVGREIISVVMNRWRQNDDATVAPFEREYGRPVLAKLPNDYRQVTEAVAMGMPLAGSQNNVLLARYRDLAEWLVRSLSATNAADVDARATVPQP